MNRPSYSLRPPGCEGIVPSQTKQEKDMTHETRELNINELDAVSGGEHIEGNGGGDHSGRGDGGGAWRGFVGSLINGVVAGAGAVGAAAGSIPVPA
jgi:hypothetical protein